MRNAILHLCAASLITWAGASLSATAAETAAETSAPTENPGPPPYRQWTLGIGIGTDTIFGGGASWRFSDHLGTRFGVGYSDFSFDHVNISGNHYDATLRLLGEPLTLDVYPWQKSSFHFSFGVLFNQNELTGTATDNGTIIIGGQPFPTDQVGSVHLKIKQQPVNPYMSIGGNFFYFDRAHHWAMGGELGAYYTGDQDVSLSRNGPPAPLIDAALKNQQKRVQNFADQFKWWPVAKIFVSYSF